MISFFIATQKNCLECATLMLAQDVLAPRLPNKPTTGFSSKIKGGLGTKSGSNLYHLPDIQSE